ncbi:MAG TPA: DUF3558 family protein, partial [Micromonospora sp.]
MGTRRIGGLALALAVTAGCGAEISGTPAAGPAAATGAESAVPAVRSPRPAVEFLGDFTTMDPCDLLDPAGVLGFGAVTEGAPVSFDNCRYDVDALPELVLLVGRLGRVPSGRVLEADGATEIPVPRGGLRVYERRDADCDRYILFADLWMLAVSARRPADGATTVDAACGVAAAAVDAVIAGLDAE